MTMFGLIVPGKEVEQFGPTCIKEGENTFYSSTFLTEKIQEVGVFLSGHVAFPDGVGAAVMFGRQDVMDGLFLGYISNNKPSDIFKIPSFKIAEVGNLPDSSGLQVTSNAQIMIFVESLTSLNQRANSQQEQASFFNNFNARKTSKSIFKKIADLPLFIPMKILKAEVFEGKTKGKFFVLTGKDEVNFNISIDDHNAMEQLNGYETITNSISNNQNPFCFFFKIKKTGTVMKILPYTPELNEKAASKKMLVRHEIPDVILQQEVEVDLLSNDFAGMASGNTE